MSIAVLTQVYEETRRLAIAGSAVAPGDFRLKKLIAPLEKAGEKAPVFAKVAQAAQAVVEANERSASGALLDLASLVNAILYTQGETGIAGELDSIETIDLGSAQTQASARMLKPLLDALTTTGSGRLELIKDAFERGAFRDLRLVRPALAALDDPYPDIAELIADQVLPMYGKAIYAGLRGTLDLKGKGGHVRRLRLLHRLDPADARDVVKRALDEGSKEVKVAAIECLGDAPEDISYLLEQTRAKASDVRAAALRALASVDAATKETVDALKKAIAGADLEHLIDSVRHSSLAEVHDFVIAEADRLRADLLKTEDKKEQAAAITRLQRLLSCLYEREDAQSEACLLRCLDDAGRFAAIKSEPSGSDLNELVARLLARATPTAWRRLVDAYPEPPTGLFSWVFLAARATLAPAALFERFAPLVLGRGQKKGKKNATKIEPGDLVEMLADEPRGLMGVCGAPGLKTISLPELDARWLDAAVAERDLELVGLLARPGHAGACRLLSEEADKLASKSTFVPLAGVLETMVRIGHPDAADKIIAFIQKQAKHGPAFGYWFARLIRELPAAAAPKFEALLPTLPERFADQLMDAVLALKNKPA